jgi:hypothetical protein
MMIFGEAITKANAKRIATEIQNRNCWIGGGIYFRSFVVLMKWTIDRLLLGQKTTLRYLSK